MNISFINDIRSLPTIFILKQMLSKLLIHPLILIAASVHEDYNNNLVLYDYTMTVRGGN
jgi:hypothetical protein